MLPRYAFPTDVVSFYVFDRDRSTPFRAEFQYEPSQGLPVALTQYAPGKVVWIDNKEWTSGRALRAGPQGTDAEAWRGGCCTSSARTATTRRTSPASEADRGERTARPAGLSSSSDQAMNWLRPPGFAHPT